MLKLIAGTNTLGKTRYLVELYNSMDDVSFIGYDDAKTRNKEVKRKIELENSSDSRVLVISELLEKAEDTIFADEIDSYVHPLDKHILYNILKQLSITLEIYATTHDIQFTTYGDEFYTVRYVDNAGQLVKLTEEEYRRLV